MCLGYCPLTVSYTHLDVYKRQGITGSDGKTTTSSIIAELLKAAGKTVHLGGNIGKPLLCEIPSFGPDDIAVLEDVYKRQVER